MHSSKQKKKDIQNWSDISQDNRTHNFFRAPEDLPGASEDLSGTNHFL